MHFLFSIGKNRSIKKSTISVSLGRINLSFEFIREGIDSDVGVVRLSVGDNENKIRVATILRENQKTFYSQSIEHMTKEADFLKGKIDPFILAQIEYILQLVKKHSTYEISSIQLTATQSLEIWYGLCTEIINKIDEVRRPIAKLIEF